jgi:desulfoferrodoxin-like iron-binding protein
MWYRGLGMLWFSIKEKNMSDSVSFDNTVTELNDGVVEEVHSIENIDTASDFELKHTPNIEVIEGANGQTIKVTIGLKGIAHPQTEEHLIEWIRAFDGTEPVGTVNFGPTDTPYAEFEVKRSGSQVIVQALCNLHGLWEARV